MSPLDYTKKRIRAFLDEISRLSESEFPYPHSKKALDILEEEFKKKLSLLIQLSPASDKGITDQTCTLILKDLFFYLPVLGFILRSTNVRNAFEVFRPILRLAGDILEPNVDKEKLTTRLILSSEWDYSPYVYRELPVLPGFALIGLPAPESSNPFLVPLSGHELGHLVWVKNKLKNHIGPEIHQALVSIIKNRWKEYKSIFPYPNIKPEGFETNIIDLENWARAQAWALKQAEESFSDFVGLSIFSTSFLHAFAYLLSPNLSEARSVNYPNMRARVRNLIKAAKTYKVEIPPEYESLFGDSGEPIMTEADRFRLSVADEALDTVVDELVAKVKGITDSSLCEKPSEAEERRIYERFRQVVPAEKARSLPDILSAAWRALEDPDLWKDIPQVKEKKDLILKEIVLKNIEVFEIEQILIKTP